MAEPNTDANSVAPDPTPPSIADWIFQLNLYEDKRTLHRHEQIRASRIYLSLLFILIAILVMTRTFTPQTNTMIVPSPSLERFQQLIEQHASTLSCPCTETLFPYHNFLSFSTTYHQVCSSDLISPAWIQSLFSVNMSRYHPLDFRNSASSQFQILALMCRFAKQSVSNAIQEFLDERFINTYAVSPALFESQMDSLSQDLKTSITSNINRLNRFLAFSMQVNRLQSNLQTNYMVRSIPGQRLYRTTAASYLKEDYQSMLDLTMYCSCDTTFNCTYFAGIYSRPTPRVNFFQPIPVPLFIIPGHFVGCLPSTAILRSTLECFYQHRCLRVLDRIGIETDHIRPLNVSQPSRYPLHIKIENLFEDLFIEDWISQSNFTAYYHQCSPAQCKYTYVTEFNVLSMLGELVGMIGGLTAACYFLVYLLVFHILRRLQRRTRSNDHAQSQDTDSMARKTLSEKFHELSRHLFHMILQLDLFEKSVIIPGLKERLMATRIHLLILVTSCLAIIFYASSNQQTITVTIDQPSYQQFERLHEQYSLTLSCPCKQLTIEHEKIISMEPIFHPICSSDFIRDDHFLLYFNEFASDFWRTNKSYHSQDFRSGQGHAFLRVLQLFCQHADEIVRDALVTFNKSKFVSNEPLSANDFEARISSLISQFQQQTVDSFLSLFELIRRMIEGNQIHVATDTNISYRSYFVNNTWIVRFHPRTYWTPDNKNCTCLVSNQCLRPQGFYCDDQVCDLSTIILPNQTIPGLNLGCYPMNSLLLSTLECFYNLSCIEMLLEWSDFFIGDRASLLPSNITALTTHHWSRFLPSTSIELILSHLLIDQWNVTKNVSNYYHHCQPAMCTYLYSSQFYVIQILTTTISFLGGFSVIMNLLIPLMIYLVKNVTDWQHRREQRHRENPFWSRLWYQLLQLNLFAGQIRYSKNATWIYIGLLMIIFFTFSLISRLNQQIFSENIRSPTEEMFDHLHRTYDGESLSCRCSQSSIPYSTFLNLSVRYHQICSSEFVQSSWWRLINSPGYETFVLLDQPLLSNHFRMLSSFCEMSRQMIERGIVTFLSDTLVSIEALTKQSFHDQIDSAVKKFIQRISKNFLFSLDYIVDILRLNQFEHLFLSNWMINFGTASENYLMATWPLSHVNHDNTTCTCAIHQSSSLCSWPMRFISNNQTNMNLLGLLSGCLPVDGLRQSTLECLYDSNCLENLTSLIPSMVNRSETIKPLTILPDSRYPSMAVPIDVMIRDLFVETWLHRSNYSLYFQACSPRLCQHTYTGHASALYVFTSLLGWYGGVTLCLRWLVLAAFKMLDRINTYYRRRQQRRVAPAPQ